MNVLFALYGDTTSNSFNPIRAFAAELIARGHSCAVATPEAPEAAVAECPVLSFDQVLKSPRLFSDGRAADLLHVWTPRELIRHFVLRYFAACGSQTPALFVDLEDHENYLVAFHLDIPLHQLFSYSERFYTKHVPPHLAHPYFSLDLLSLAAGVTVIHDNLLEFVPRHVPTLVLPLGVDLEFWSPENGAGKERRADLGIDESHRVIVYHGGVNPFVRGDILELYHAIPIINRRIPCKLVLTGPGHDDFLKSVDDEVARDIHYLGYVDRARLPGILALADLFVQPGLPGAFNEYRLPGKIPEFLAMGRPLVLPEANIGRSLQEGKAALLLRQGTANEIAEKCLWAFDHPEEAAKIGDNGRRFAVKHFDIRSKTAELIDFYESTPKAKAGAGPWEERGREVTARALRSFLANGGETLDLSRPREWPTDRLLVEQALRALQDLGSEVREANRKVELLEKERDELRRVPKTLRAAAHLVRRLRDLPSG